jgi:hypothetical protein
MPAPATATAEQIRSVNTRYHDGAAAGYDAKWGIDYGEVGRRQVLGQDLVLRLEQHELDSGESILIGALGFARFARQGLRRSQSFDMKAQFTCSRTPLRLYSMNRPCPAPMATTSPGKPRHMALSPPCRLQVGPIRDAAPGSCVLPCV